jgi:hypothetical protein
MRSRVVARIVVGFAMLALASTARAARAPAWSILPSPDPAGAAGSELSGVSCPSRAACVAVGDFVDGSGHGVPLVERWNGRVWSIQRIPIPTAAEASLLFAASCAAPTACIAVGSTTDLAGGTVPLAERWNGVRWSTQQTPRLPARRGYVSYLGGVSCTSRRLCVAVGYSGNSAGSSGMGLVERWNGVRWLVQRTPRPAGSTVSFLTSVSCVSSTSCTAAGFFHTRAGVGRTLTERWNGTRWSIQRTPTPEGAVAVQLVGVSCTVTRPCVAAGYFAIDTGIEVMLAERWSGVRWSIERTLYPDHAAGVRFAGVSCASSTACTAVGFFVDTYGFDETLAERSDGARWRIQETPNPGGVTSSSLAGVSCASATMCVAVGSYIDPTGTEVTLAERYSPQP